MFKGFMVGRVGGDPDLRATSSGKPVVSFSMATDTKFGDKKITTWQRIVAWGGAAENLAKYVRKGHQLAVEGRMLERSWVDREDRTHKVLELHVDNFQLLSNGPKPGTDTTPEETIPEADEVDTADMP